VDTWWLRRHPAVRALAFRPEARRQDRINWQIRFIEGDLTADEETRLAEALSAPPAEAFTAEARTRWIAALDDVAFASDGALPLRDNVDHARRHGVRYIAEPGGRLDAPDPPHALPPNGGVAAGGAPVGARSPRARRAGP
jgi:phosphoribosylaminoimidazolecarboxamide formyltransferase/IMP cyclohydrolase